MKIKDCDLYDKGLISQNVLYIDDKAYKIIGYDAETCEFNLMEVKKKN